MTSCAAEELQLQQRQHATLPNVSEHAIGSKTLNQLASGAECGEKISAGCCVPNRSASSASLIRSLLLEQRETHRDSHCAINQEERRSVLLSVWFDFTIRRDHIHELWTPDTM